MTIESNLSTPIKLINFGVLLTTKIKDLEIEIVETIKNEIIEEVVNNLDEVKFDDCNIQVPIFLVGDTEIKFIDFIGGKI